MARHFTVDDSKLHACANSASMTVCDQMGVCRSRRYVTRPDEAWPVGLKAMIFFVNALTNQRQVLLIQARLHGVHEA